MRDKKESERQRNRKSQTTDASCSFGVGGCLPACHIRLLKSGRKKSNRKRDQTWDSREKKEGQKNQKRTHMLHEMHPHKTYFRIHFC